MSWDKDPPKEIELRATGAKSWDEDPPEAAPSKVTSAIRGAAQGVSMGFGDEIQGVMEAGGRAIGVKGLGANNFDQSLQKPTWDIEELKKAYHEARDSARTEDKKAKEANPGSYFGGELVGGIAGGKKLPLGQVGTLPKAMMSGAGFGAVTGLGASESETVGGMAKDTVLGAGAGAVGGAVAHGGGKLIGAVGDRITSARRAAGEKVGEFAEKAAVNATGATGRQSEKFADNAGRELLDRKIVRFGDSQEKIAERAGQALNSAEDKISSSLEKLEAAGVKVDQNDIYNSIRSKIKELKGNPSNADIVNGLEKELNNIIAATDEAGSTKVGVKFGEEIKRGYGRKAGNWADPESAQVGKELYQTYRKGVEDAAQKADPTTAKLFDEGKKAYGLLAPIEEAASRRAATTTQSPVGGLLDIATLGVGGVKAVIGRKLLAPRVASSVAVTADSVSKRLLSTEVGANLARENPKGFQSAVLNLTKQLQSESSHGKVANEKNESSPPSPADAPPPADTPKGEEKWARDGLQKLKSHGDVSVSDEELFANPKAKRLLVAASDLKPGSKAMQNIALKIQSELEKGNRR